MLGLMPKSIKQMGFPSMVCNPLERFARLSQFLHLVRRDESARNVIHQAGESIIAALGVYL